MPMTILSLFNSPILFKLTLAGIEDNKSWFRPVNIGSFSHIKVKAISGGQHHTILLDSEGEIK